MVILGVVRRPVFVILETKLALLGVPGSVCSNLEQPWPTNGWPRLIWTGSREPFEPKNGHLGGRVEDHFWSF